jgi:hypothetical protein
MEVVLRSLLASALGGGGGVGSQFHSLVNRPAREGPLLPSGRRLVWHKGRFGRFGKKKSRAGIEFRLRSSPGHSLITTPTTQYSRP